MSARAKTEKIREMLRAAYGENRSLAEIPAGAPYARCENGTFVGKRAGGVAVYRGIPFAAPPVGERRWKKPEPAAPREGIFEAYYNGRTPLQSEWPTEVASFYPQGEDCLYLNLWRNEEDRTPDRPVMVFFHGGSYGWGGTADPMYDGTNFVTAQGDILLVTVGYRTGLMGFVDFSAVPGGEDYPDAPNLGILDQMEALRWVQRNIRAFGGDPGNVTIFGESAGAGSVSLLSTIRSARGLFRRVIAESGSVTLSSSKAECEDFTRRLLKVSGAKTMAELAALSEEQLKKYNEKINYYNNFPQRDGHLIPEDPFAPYVRGDTAGIDLLLGTNRDEANYWIGESGGILPYKMGGTVKFENDLKKLKPEDRARVKTFLKSEKALKIWRMTAFYTETMFHLPAIRQADEHSKNGGSVWMYYWAEPSAIAHYGACHAVELAYVFGNLQETIYTGMPGDQELSGRVQRMWANFARNGDPGTEEMPWPRYTAKDRDTMVFSRKGESVQRDIGRTARELLTPLLDYWLDPTSTQMSLNVPYVWKLAGGAILMLAFILWLILW